jgi:Protein of unknown function (DUF2975)
MSSKTDYFFKTLHVVSWIIFVGVCLEAGVFIVSTLLTLFKPELVDKLWREVDLLALYQYNQSHFVSLTALMIIVALMRALMFYFIIEIFYNKQFSLEQPFNEAVKRFISNTAYLALGIGLFSAWGAKLATNLVAIGIKIPDIQQLRLGGADVWLFMGVTLLVIAQVFKKGIALQNENDLTV